MSLVTLAEFAGFLQQSFDDEQAYTAQQALDDATATILDEIGQPLESSTDTVIRDGTGTCELILPRWPVTAVTSVTILDADGDPDGDEELTFGSGGYRWSDSGILTRVGAVWPCRPRAVEVAYTAGYVSISDDLKRICRRLAASQMPNPGGAESESIGDHTVKWYGPPGELTPGEIRQLEKYQAH